MPKQTKIKDLLKEIGEIQARDGGEINEYPEYAELADAIKSLRKENKALKQVKSVCIELVKEYKQETDKNFDNLCKSLPIGGHFAEFKCAKTNKPERIGSYSCIVMGNKPYFSSATWDGSNFILHSGSEVIAFTETEPGEIASCLNKEK